MTLVDEKRQIVKGSLVEFDKFLPKLEDLLGKNDSGISLKFFVIELKNMNDLKYQEEIVKTYFDQVAKEKTQLAEENKVKS